MTEGRGHMDKKTMSYKKATPLDVMNTQAAVKALCEKGSEILGPDWDRFQSLFEGRALGYVRFRQEGIHIWVERTLLAPTLEDAIWSCMGIVGKMRQPVIDRLVAFIGCEEVDTFDYAEYAKTKPVKKPETKILDPFDFVFDPLALLESVKA